jgi:hypothetical protein
MGAGQGGINLAQRSQGAEGVFLGRGKKRFRAGNAMDGGRDMT